VTTGLGETIPLLNGVTSLTNEASSLNSTAASITSLVTSGTHTVSQIESKGIGVRTHSGAHTHSATLKLCVLHATLFKQHYQGLPAMCSQHKARLACLHDARPVASRD